MVTANEAEVTLKTIRSLMERATIYRAVSANTAVLGGVLALALSAGWVIAARAGMSDTMNFIGSWLIVCLFVSIVNTVVLHKQAWLRNEPFVSPGMKLALRGIFPPVLAAAVLTVILPPVPVLVTLWMIFYGLALLSTQEFAPVSIRWLGWAFVLAGVLTGLLGSLMGILRRSSPEAVVFGAVAMGVSFGLLHLIYGFSLLYGTKAEAAALSQTEKAR